MTPNPETVDDLVAAGNAGLARLDWEEARRCFETAIAREQVTAAGTKRVPISVALPCALPCALPGGARQQGADWRRRCDEEEGCGGGGQG
jgi:hypothetical protein